MDAAARQRIANAIQRELREHLSDDAGEWTVGDGNATAWEVTFTEAGAAVVENEDGTEWAEFDVLVVPGKTGKYDDEDEV